MTDPSSITIDRPDGADTTGRWSRCSKAIKDGWNHWHAFWFAPADSFTLGIIRILTGGMLLYTLLVWGLEFDAFFGDDGLQPRGAIDRFHNSEPVFSLWFFVPGDWLLPVHWCCVGFAALFFLGVATRITSVAAFLVAISYSQRVPVANFGLDQLLGLLCLYLAIGPSGTCLSIDAFVRGRFSRNRSDSSQIPTVSSARIALRLIQIHMCVIYFWAGFAKLKGDSWWTGAAMWQVMATVEYQTADLTWMAYVPWLPHLLAHLTVMWEVFFCVLIWNRTLRPLMLTIGTAMHFGIGAFLGMWTFGLIMTFAYFAFSDSARWRRRLRFAGVMQPETTPTPSVTAKSTATTERTDSDAAAGLLLVAAHPEERTTLRNYFRRHNMPCRAATTAENAFSLVNRVTPQAIVLSGSRLTPEQVSRGVADLQDFCDVPVLAILLPSQHQMLRSTNFPARVMLYPASPREIREEVYKMVFEDEDASPV